MFIFFFLTRIKFWISFGAKKKCCHHGPVGMDERRRKYEIKRFIALLDSSWCFVCFWFWLSAAITFRITSVGKYWYTGHSTHTAVCEEHALKWHSFQNVRSKTVAQKENGCTTLVCLLVLRLFAALLFRYLYRTLTHTHVIHHRSHEETFPINWIRSHTHKESEWNRSWSLAFKNYYHTHTEHRRNRIFTSTESHACMYLLLFFLTSDTDAHFWLGNNSRKKK